VLRTRLEIALAPQYVDPKGCIRGIIGDLSMAFGGSQWGCN